MDRCRDDRLVFLGCSTHVVYLELSDIGLGLLGCRIHVVYLGLSAILLGLFGCSTDGQYLGCRIDVGICLVLFVGLLGSSSDAVAVGRYLGGRRWWREGCGDGAGGRCCGGAGGRCCDVGGGQSPLQGPGSA